jgi:hypothetical protein
LATEGTPRLDFSHRWAPELQFNIGFKEEKFRHGVAFSLQPARPIQGDIIEHFFPKIEKVQRIHADLPRGIRRPSDLALYQR